MKKKSLRFFHDYVSSYDQLLEKSGKAKINVFNNRTLWVGCLNNLNLSFLSDIFQLRLTNRPPRDKWNLNLEIAKTDQVKFGTKSLWTFGPKLWNSLPHHIKLIENLITLKIIMKKWNRVQWECTVCTNDMHHMQHFCYNNSFFIVVCTLS